MQCIADGGRHPVGLFCPWLGWPQFGRLFMAVVDVSCRQCGRIPLVMMTPTGPNYSSHRRQVWDDDWPSPAMCLVWPWVASGVLGSGVGGWCCWVRALAPDTCSVGPEAVLSVVLCTSLFLFVVCLFQTKLLYDIFCMLQGRVVLSGCPWPRWADIC